MRQFQRIPVALSIAGSDSGGGAGIQADLHTFAALGVHGTTAVTCLTAQNPTGVRAVQPASARLVVHQIEAVMEALAPKAIKTGMLYSGSIINAVARTLKSCGTPLVIDPVMVSTSGARLLKDEAMRSLQMRLLPMATLITPNLDEAVILAGAQIRDVEGLRSAARIIADRYGCAVLVKGGHLKGTKQAVDVLFDGSNEWTLKATFIKGVSTHGTGCTYSAAITAYLAQGNPLKKAVTSAKTFITQAIAASQLAAQHTVLNWASGSQAMRAIKQ